MAPRSTWLVLIGTMLCAACSSNVVRSAGEKDVPRSTASPASCRDGLAAIEPGGVSIVSVPGGRLAVVDGSPDALRNAARVARSAPPPDLLLLPPDSPSSAEIEASGIPALKPQVVQLPTSTLASRPEIAFGISRVESGATQLALIVHEPPNGAAEPVALISAVADGPSMSVKIDLLPRPRPLATDVQIGLLERLYSLSLRYSADGRFTLSGHCAGCDTQAAEPQDALLRRLATLRECLGNERGAASGRPLAPWHMVSLVPLPAALEKADLVEVTASVAGTPLADVRIIFSQGLASTCSARTDVRGLASCRLVDQDPDDDDARTKAPPVIATFPGKVEPDLILPPTTKVFARP